MINLFRNEVNLVKFNDGGKKSVDLICFDLYFPFFLIPLYM